MNIHGKNVHNTFRDSVFGGVGVIKGCNKRVIVMKETGNAMIEEAIFILKADFEKGGLSENNIVRHANSILDKNSYADRFSCLSMNVAKQKQGGKIPMFLLGAAMGAAIAVSIMLII